MGKKIKTTYEKFIDDEVENKILQNEYQELLLSELLIAAMQKNHLSVRKLASVAGVSPTIIQELKSGLRTNITIDTLSKILDAIDYKIVFVPKNQST